MTNICCDFGQGKQGGPSAFHPVTGPSVDHDDGLLVKELNSMTFKEREMVFEEVHGVSNSVDETPEFLQNRLNAMREVLSKVPKQKRKALDRACFLRPSLVGDDKLHLMFLRAVRYDPATAARMMYLHFEHKLELFGESKLVKRITWDDLDEEDKEAFWTGSVRFLSQKDQAGRTVRLMNPLHGHYKTKGWRPQVRYTWYQTMAMLEDEEVQIKGAVDVIYLYDGPAPVGHLWDLLTSASHIMTNWPIRFCGLHICYDSPALNSLLKSLHIICGKELRLRQRIHFGSKLEVKYSLMSFGISLPDDVTLSTGTASKASIEKLVKERQQKDREWEEERQKAESRTPGAAMIAHPKANDVLMGRGRPFRAFSGNIRLSQIVASYADRYSHASERIEKTMLAMEILQRIQLDGGRFLQRKGDGWELVEDQVAKEKISQALRVEVRQQTAKSSGRSTFQDNEVLVPDPKRMRVA